MNILDNIVIHLLVMNSLLPVLVLLIMFCFAGLGLLVFLEIVHSYAAADEMVGLSLFDGTNDCYFHTGIVFKRMFRST